jgi:hypothetical protein
MLNYLITQWMRTSRGIELNLLSTTLPDNMWGQRKMLYLTLVGATEFPAMASVVSFYVGESVAELTVRLEDGTTHVVGFSRSGGQLVRLPKLKQAAY